MSFENAKQVCFEIGTLMRKESLESLREYKSVLFFIVFCTVFFPMFSLLGNPEISAALITDSLAGKKGKIGVRGDIDLVRQVLKDKKDLEVKPLLDLDPVQSVDDCVFDIVVVTPEATSTKEKTVDVFYSSHAEGTIAWAIQVAAAMSSSELQVLKARLRKIGIDKFTNGIPNVDYKNILNVQRQGAAPLSESLPCVILFFITTVAIGGAIGGVTQERENRRLAQLLLLPINRASILYSILFVVSFLSLLPVLAGLCSLSWAFSLDFITQKLLSNHLVVSIPSQTILGLMLLSIPIAIAVMASSILFASYFRISQQARGYSLIYMLVLNGAVRYLLSFKSLAVLFPFIPVSNSVYVMQEMLDGKTDLFQITVATAITLATSALMIHIAAIKLSDEKLLMGVERAPKAKRKLKEAKA